MGPEGLRVIDVSDPRQAVAHRRARHGRFGERRSVSRRELCGLVILSDEAPDVPNDCEVVIADGAGGIKVVNVAEDGAPSVISSLDTGRYAVHVAVSGDLIAAAEEDDGVGLYRLGAGGSLTQLSSTPLPGGTVRGVAFSGKRCFVAAGLAGLLTLDVTDPARPKLIGSFPAKHYARGVSVKDGTILLADSQGGSG